MVEPRNQKLADIIVQGALRFASVLENELVKYNHLDLVEVEPYPQDTFTVLIYFRKGRRHYSLNMEEICFDIENRSFSTIRRIYSWIEVEDEEGYEARSREFLYQDKHAIRIPLRPEAVEDSFRELYNKVAEHERLPLV